MQKFILLTFSILFLASCQIQDSNTLLTVKNNEQVTWWNTAYWNYVDKIVDWDAVCYVHSRWWVSCVKNTKTPISDN